MTPGSTFPSLRGIPTGTRDTMSHRLRGGL